MMRVVVDTSVFVSAVLGRAGGASRKVLRGCLQGSLEPLMGNALMLEYEEVLERPKTIRDSRLTADEIGELLDAFLSVCSWVTIYYGWRPSLPDEEDHHLLELAVAGGAEAIVTKNVRDLRGELRFPDLKVVTPAELAREI